MFHLYGLLLGLGLVAGFTAAERAANKEQRKLLGQVAMWMGVGALIGARLYHLMTDWQLYTNATLIDLIAVWRGGLGIYGAVGGAILGCIVYLWHVRKLSTHSMLTILDLLAFGLPLGQAIGRWGNYFNHELFGLPTTLPWGIFIPSENRPAQFISATHFHPLFLYESLAMLTLWIFLWKKKYAVGTGKTFSVYLFYYSLVRFFLDFLRIDSSRLYSQVVSLCMIAVGCWLLYTSRKKSARI